MTRRVGVALFVAVSVSCSARSLSPDRAAALIAALDEFGREAHFSLETDVPLQTAFGADGFRPSASTSEFISAALKTVYIRSITRFCAPLNMVATTSSA
jgi:hypothetical protein